MIIVIRITKSPDKEILAQGVGEDGRKQGKSFYKIFKEG